MKPLLAASLALALTACGTQPRTQPNPEIGDWQRHVERQHQLSHWQLQGKLGVRLPQDSPPGLSVNWRQRQQQFEVHLNGPLGFGAAQLSGSPQQVTMRRGDQQYRAANSEQLTRRLLGMPLSVEALTFWARGIPDPSGPVGASSHSATGTLASLQQHGWQLQFDRYRDIDGWLLPGKISGQRGELSFKLVIKAWQTGLPD